MLGLIFIPSGMKEDAHQADGASRANSDGQNHECLAWEYLLEGVVKHDIA
jgi:hypothetical protein